MTRRERPRPASSGLGRELRDAAEAALRTEDTDHALTRRIVCELAMRALADETMTSDPAFVRDVAVTLWGAAKLGQPLEDLTPPAPVLRLVPRGGVR